MTEQHTAAAGSAPRRGRPVAPHRGHAGEEEGRDRLLDRRHHRDLRLHRLRHRRGAVLQQRLLPGDRPARRARCSSFATLGIGFAVRPLGGIIGGYLGDQIGRKPVLVGSLLLMGIATVLIGVPAHLPAGRRLGRDPARRRPRRAGPRVRRRVGRRDPHVLRARALAQEGPLHRHHAGRLPGRAAAGQPRLPGQRAAGRPVGVAGAVPAQRGPDRRRHPHPAQDRGVARSSRSSRKRATSSKNPLLEVLRDDWRNVLRAFCLRIAETAGYAVSVTFILSYLVEREAGRPRRPP